MVEPEAIAVPQPPSAARPVATLVLLGLPLAAALLVLYRFDPASAGFFPPCPLHALTGLNCPGCGMLRATHALLHGHLGAALRLNPLAIGLLPLVAALGFAQILRPGLATRLPGWVVRLLAVALVAFGALRSIPAYPFTLLAPH